jgi:metal-responsive CopG/Arc/MetJ family transcriptional regulator
VTAEEKVTLPKQLVDTVREIVPPREVDKFIAEAVAHYIVVKRRQRLREELIAGYQTFAPENQRLAETWAPLASEAWQAYAPDDLA